MDIQAQPMVSFLTPVYNAEKYLADCIESVLAQTYENWEYVIVDNCSTDCSLEIAKRYASKDERIRIHNNQQHVGIIQNHNIAFRKISAKSKYCKMLHADDYLFPECTMQMVKVAEDNPTVGIVGSYMLQGAKVVCDKLPYPNTFVSGREICRSDLLAGPGTSVFGSSPTALLIRSDLIRKYEAFYNESNIFADREVCYEVLQYSDFGFVHQVLTLARVHPEQATSLIRRLSPYMPGKIKILKKYGSIYLGKEECEKLLNQRIKTYYRFLGKSVFQLREEEFWSHHKSVLKEIGYPLSRYKLACMAMLEIVNYALNPKMTVEKICRRISKSAR
jgi:glycosyltransferase involved in cell wall biosynthesis